MCAGTYACQSLLKERRRCHAVRGKRPRERCPGQRRETPGSSRAPEAERKAFRMHQGENAAKLTIFVLRREREHALPIFTLENTKPSGMVVNEAVRMSGHEVIPSRIRFEIDFYDSHEGLSAAVFAASEREPAAVDTSTSHPIVSASAFGRVEGSHVDAGEASIAFSTAASQSRGSSGG